MAENRQRYVADGLCCIKGCEGLIRTAEMCNTHYMNMWKYGHPLNVGGTRNERTARVYKPRMRERWSWNAMKYRCSSPKSENYVHYGARDIRVCDRWLESFENFYADMGPKPNGHSLGRLNNDYDYAPTNCRWVTIDDQQRNKSDTVLDEKTVLEILRRDAAGESIASIARAVSIGYAAVYQAARGVSWRHLRSGTSGRRRKMSAKALQLAKTSDEIAASLGREKYSGR